MSLNINYINTYEKHQQIGKDFSSTCGRLESFRHSVSGKFKCAVCKSDIDFVIGLPS